MSYTARAYREFSEVLEQTLDEIFADETIDYDRRRAEEAGVARAIEKIAAIFEDDNPRGFDKDRFFNDIYGPEE